MHSVFKLYLLATTWKHFSQSRVRNTLLLFTVRKKLQPGLEGFSVAMEHHKKISPRASSSWGWKKNRVCLFFPAFTKRQHYLETSCDTEKEGFLSSCFSSSFGQSSLPGPNRMSILGTRFESGFFSKRSPRCKVFSSAAAALRSLCLAARRRAVVRASR